MTTKRIVTIQRLLILSGWVLMTHSAAAQQEAPEPVRLVLPEPSQGHHVAFGYYGIGAMAFDPGRQTRKPTLGSGFNLRLGEAVTEWLDLGINFAYGSTSGEIEDKMAFGRFTIHSQWYLSQHWYAHLGLGAGSVSGPDPRDPSADRGGYSEVYTAGMGYNWFLSDAGQSGGWVLSPVLTLDMTPSKDMTSTALWLGLELSWWSGLSRDKLELPPEQAYE